MMDIDGLFHELYHGSFSGSFQCIHLPVFGVLCLDIFGQPLVIVSLAGLESGLCDLEGLF